MTLLRRNFTPEDRFVYSAGREREGHTATTRNYHIAPSLYARMKGKYFSEGNHGIMDRHRRKDPELRLALIIGFMSENNNEKVLSSLDESVKLIGGIRQFYESHKLRRFNSFLI